MVRTFRANKDPACSLHPTDDLGRRHGLTIQPLRCTSTPSPYRFVVRLARSSARCTTPACCSCNVASSARSAARSATSSGVGFSTAAAASAAAFFASAAASGNGLVERHPVAEVQLAQRPGDAAVALQGRLQWSAAQQLSRGKPQKTALARFRLRARPDRSMDCRATHPRRSRGSIPRYLKAVPVSILSLDFAMFSPTLRAAFAVARERATASRNFLSSRSDRSARSYPVRCREGGQAGMSRVQPFR